jgi:hypothetical protein
MLCCMIPAFEADGNLPPGVHLTTWELFEARYGVSAHRLRLIKGLSNALAILRIAGCRRVYVDGSFVTAKAVPMDYDVAWDPTGVDLAALKAKEPVFWDFSNLRAAQKAKFLGEFLPSSATEAGCGKTFLEFFQIDKNTGMQKGIIALDL